MFVEMGPLVYVCYDASTVDSLVTNRFVNQTGSKVDQPGVSGEHVKDMEFEKIIDCVLVVAEREPFQV